MAFFSIKKGKSSPAKGIWISLLRLLTTFIFFQKAEPSISKGRFTFPVRNLIVK
jgi:hypothetical protein